MKTTLLSAFIIGMFFYATMAIADNGMPNASSSADASFPLATWVSKSSNDAFTIQNGAGITIVVMITVNGVSPNDPGVNVKNCGTTAHINAGSSAVCTTNDSANPVTLNSDSAKPATGTYQIKQR